MKKTCLIKTVAWLALAGLCLVSAAHDLQATPAAALSDEFVGPFPSWADAKRDYGAVGDGQNDDTAALQKALDELRREERKRFVLYLPAGTYRLTRTLVLLRERHNEAKDISIIGEAPENTVLLWDGPAGGVMFDYGAWYSKVGRLTFDGKGKARTAIAHGKQFATFNEFSDLIIRDVGIGIEAGAPGGQGIAETTVLRSTFQRCSVAGISIQNFNSLDWFIWQSHFEDCGYGVTNTKGAGNYHVYNSTFLRSTTADLGMGNTEYFSIRHNTSINSKAFFVAGGIGACGMVTLQGNTVYAPDVKTPIQVGNLGPLLLLDNWIVSKVSPVVKANLQGSLFAEGNTFEGGIARVEQAIQANPKALMFENRIGQGLQVERLAPQTPTNLQRTIIEVPVGAPGSAIQAAIRAAAQRQGQRPVVHVPAGNYRIEQTVEIPAGSDVQLVGDGARSRLEWAGQGRGPVLRLKGPARATLRDLEISGARRADGLVIENSDQHGARIFMEQANITRAQQVGLLVHGLKYANVELHGINHANCGLGVKVIGPTDGSYEGGRVAIFGGASSNNTLSYEVAEGGRLLAQDIWYESRTQSRFMRASGTGDFTLHGAKVAVALKEEEPALEFDDFSGSMSFLNVVFIGSNMKPAPMVIQGEGKKTAVLVLGALVGIGEGYFANRSPYAQAALLEAFRYTPGGGATRIPNVGQADAVFIRNMIQHTRMEKPQPLSPIPEGTTDVRLFRVLVSQTHNGIQLHK
jgi:hypothetical protein